MTTAIEHLGVDQGNAAPEEFKREPRYIVFKLKDVHAYLKAAEIRQLEKIGSTIAVNRAFHGKPPFNAVVVEQDWPEFDLVWQMIEARMTGTGNDHRRYSACVNACEGIPTETLDKIAHCIGMRADVLMQRLENCDEQATECERLKQELGVTDKLLTERQRVLDAIPECEAHGPCVTHALEWIADVKSMLVAIAHDSTESEVRRKRAEELMGPNATGEARPE